MSTVRMQKLVTPPLTEQRLSNSTEINNDNGMVEPNTTRVDVKQFAISSSSKNTINLESNLIVCKDKTVISRNKLVNFGTKIDYNKVAILLEDNNTELLEQYRENLKKHSKQSVQFIPGKYMRSMEQAFIRLKKQGIRFVTVCSKKLINSTPSKILKYNAKWQKILHKNELLFVRPDDILDKNIATAGLMTKRIPNDNDLRDVALGVYTLNSLTYNKNGQSVVVQAGKVLGIESEAETTNDLIDRCLELKTAPRGGILFKVTKPHQRYTLLYPNIDAQTILDAHIAKLSGIVVNANYCHMDNMPKLIKLAERKHIFIMGI